MINKKFLRNTSFSNKEDDFLLDKTKSPSNSILSNSSKSTYSNVSTNIKDVSKFNKPYQEESQCAYKEYLKYNQLDFIKENDYIWKEDHIYFIIDVNKSNNTFTMVNLENNNVEKYIYPFYYCKIDGNDPNVLIKTFININKNKH